MTDLPAAAWITAGARALHADRCVSESCREFGHTPDQLLASVHMSGDQSADLHISRVVLEAAAPHIAAAAAAAERQRIRQLAERRNAIYFELGEPDPDGEPSGMLPFADLLEDTP